MRVQPNREELAQAHLDVFTADQARLLLHSVRLLAKGAPVSLEQLAEASHLAREQVQELFQASSIELNREGNLPALALSLQPTPHQFHLGEKSLYTGCALDALIVPTLLGRSARVTSSCPVTGTQNSSDGDPGGTLAPGTYKYLRLSGGSRCVGGKHL